MGTCWYASHVGHRSVRDGRDEDLCVDVMSLRSAWSGGSFRSSRSPHGWPPRANCSR